MSVYQVRQRTAVLTATTGHSDDTLFANQRFDGLTLRDVRFSQCTFANVSFKRSRLVGCHFSGCVFEGCYFRETEIRDTTFPATRFIDSEFVKPRIIDSNFGQARFDRTVVAYADMEASLPPLANICRDMAARLAVQASNLGQDVDARRYRLTSISRGEVALWRAWRGADEYSRQHYPTGLDRAGALLQLTLSRINGILWGYGESMRRLLLNAVVLSAVIFPVLYLLSKDGLSARGSVTTGDAWLLSFGSILNNSGSTGITSTGFAEAMVLVETALGFLFFGLFVTYLFRAVTRR